MTTMKNTLIMLVISCFLSDCKILAFICIIKLDKRGDIYAILYPLVHFFVLIIVDNDFYLYLLGDKNRIQSINYPSKSIKY